MAQIPHQFEKLTSKEEKAVLMVGAGLSYGIVPMAAGLLPIAQKVAEELNLPYELFAHIDTASSDGKNSAIYHYSDVILQKYPDKLAYAKKLGILSDPKWYAKVGLPLRGTTPRHRVIARFAREQLWHEIWSFNWDTVLESALEAVGFERGRQDGIKQPWNTLFDSLITSNELAPSPSDNVFKIYKPHGCLHSMKKAEELSVQYKEESKEISDRFMIGYNELSNYADWWGREPGQTFLSQLHISLNHPVTIVGWSIPEGYLHDKIGQVMQPMKATMEHLSIVDPWFNEQGHKIITQRYELTKESVHIAVLPAQPDLSTDQLFLALQTKYSLKQLLKNTDDDSLEYTSIQNALNDCNLGNANGSLLTWADDFLPAWIRLCWRSGIITLRSFKMHDLRLEKHDVHIPYCGIEVTRIDLEMAGKFFYLIQQSGQSWDYSSFPGGLWDYEKRRLVIPLPNADYNSLYALKPLIQTIEQKIGFIAEIVIIPISHHSIPESSYQKIRNTIQQIASKPALWQDNFWKVKYNLIDFEEIT